MYTLLLLPPILIPVAAWLAWRSRLACLLRALPDENEDFMHF